MATEERHTEPLAGVYNSDFRHGLGVAALVLSMVTFLSMLGLEKAITALVLGVLAMRGSQPGSPARNRLRPNAKSALP